MYVSNTRSTSKPNLSQEFFFSVLDISHLTFYQDRKIWGHFLKGLQIKTKKQIFRRVGKVKNAFVPSCSGVMYTGGERTFPCWSHGQEMREHLPIGAMDTGGERTSPHWDHEHRRLENISLLGPWTQEARENVSPLGSWAQEAREHLPMGAIDTGGERTSPY